MHPTIRRRRIITGGGERGALHNELSERILIRNPGDKVSSRLCLVSLDDG